MDLLVNYNYVKEKIEALGIFKVSLTDTIEIKIDVTTDYLHLLSDETIKKKCDELSYHLINYYAYYNKNEMAFQVEKYVNDLYKDITKNRLYYSMINDIKNSYLF